MVSSGAPGAPSPASTRSTRPDTPNDALAPGRISWRGSRRRGGAGRRPGACGPGHRLLEHRSLVDVLQGGRPREGLGLPLPLGISAETVHTPEAGIHIIEQLALTGGADLHRRLRSATRRGPLFLQPGISTLSPRINQGPGRAKRSMAPKARSLRRRVPGSTSRCTSITRPARSTKAMSSGWRMVSVCTSRQRGSTITVRSGGRPAKPRKRMSGLAATTHVPPKGAGAPSPTEPESGRRCTPRRLRACN